MQAQLQGSFTGRTVALRPQPQKTRCSRVVLRIDCKDSRIGKQPITVPKTVTVTINDSTLRVKGPKGELLRTFPDSIAITQEEGKIWCKKKFEDRQANAVHGLVRSLASNMVQGVSEGYEKTLSLLGVGYRAAVSGSSLTLNLGYSNPVQMTVPKGLSVAVVKNTTLTISGFDKELVGQFAASVRDKRPPEPYKGKGVRYVDEEVRRKEGKRGK
ncbi:hypothetical protein WJX72_004429 [[Myrmecia] bisecta]|uniref:Large ribosomal subunit protein uL6c n=1 Tax=[Myrmecia] bisecta TaxID=41462 RepID=A0AAW1QRE7_9CHLO